MRTLTRRRGYGPTTNPTYSENLMTTNEFEALVSSDLAMLVAAAQAKQRAAEQARIEELVAEGMTLEQAMMMFDGEQE